MKLQVHIEQDEAGYFVAEVPALPGCFSQGRSREQAIENVQEAIAGWLEVMESHDERKREEFVEVVV
jgi:predicted RNase H-like HicB family nuclease